ncbi:MAG: hypothetical protein Q4C36_01925, partial [Coriobacteriia bacterium]|nr:hypothetical protein [Coriobacteriia bacterium]
MQIRSKIMPLVLSGTLAFGTMGMPLSAYASTVDKYDTNRDGAKAVEQDLSNRVAAGELDEAAAKSILSRFMAAVQEENEAAQRALEEAEAAKAAAAEAEAAVQEEAD